VEVGTLQEFSNLPTRIWDSHVHLFPEKMMEAVYAYFERNYFFSLPYTTCPDALLGKLIENGTDKAFILIYAHKPGIARELNRWLFKFCSNNPRLAPFGAINPGDSDPLALAEECLDTYDFPGIKLHCLVQKHPPDDERLFPVYRAIEERNKAVIIHASTFPQQLEGCLGSARIRNLLEHFPKLNLVVPHLGLNELDEYRDLLGKYEGLHMDTSFVFQNQGFIPPLEEIKSVITAYPDRFFYGSDYPFIMEPTQNGIERTLELDLPRDVIDRLFYKNAEEFLQKVKTPVKDKEDSAKKGS